MIKKCIILIPSHNSIDFKTLGRRDVGHFIFFIYLLIGNKHVTNITYQQHKQGMSSHGKHDWIIMGSSTLIIKQK